MPSTRRGWPLALAALLVAGAAVAVGTAITSVTAQTVVFEQGDVLVTVGGGEVKHFTSAGRLIQVLDSGASGETGALAFDAGGGFYVSEFTANAVSRFDSGGRFAGAVTGLDSHPEALVTDSAGNVFVGLNDGSRELLRVDPEGRIVDRFQPAVERRGIDRADLAADQCTLFYTSEGRLVKRFNVCTGTQMADFAALDITGDNTATPTSSAYGLRVRPNGEVLVATSGAVIRLNPAGTVIRTYQVPGTVQLVGLSLDPDLTSFWVADQSTGTVTRLDIETGDVVTSFPTSPTVAVGAVAVVGEITAARPALQLAVAAASETVGNSATVTATLVNAPPVEGRLVRFTVEGANPGTGTATTDAEGRATFTYASERTGTDTVVVTADAGNPPRPVSSRPVTVEWTDAPSTAVTYGGPGTAQLGETVVLTARATHGPLNGPLTGVPLSFRIGDAVACSSAPTDADGVASCSTVPSGEEGRRAVTVTFAGTPTASPGTATGELEVARRVNGTPTALNYTGTGAVLEGEDVTLAARLTDARGGQPVAGAALTFTVEQGGTCSTTTNDAGVGSCLVPSPPTPGQRSLTVTSAATPTLLGASTTGRLLVTEAAGVVQTGRASALAATTTLLPPIILADTGEVLTEGTSTTARTFLDLPLGIINAKVGDARVATQPGLSRADANLLELTVNLPGLLNLHLRGVDASSRSSCGTGAVGESRIAYLALGQLVLLDGALSPTPNTVLSVPGLSSLVKIVLNEQIPLPEGAGTGLTVNAVRISVAGLADIVVSSARSDLHNCPATA